MSGMSADGAALYILRAGWEGAEFIKPVRSITPMGQVTSHKSACSSDLTAEMCVRLRGKESQFQSRRIRFREPITTSFDG